MVIEVLELINTLSESVACITTSTHCGNCALAFAAEYGRNSGFQVSVDFEAEIGRRLMLRLGEDYC